MQKRAFITLAAASLIALAPFGAVANAASQPVPTNTI